MITSGSARYLGCYLTHFQVCSEQFLLRTDPFESIFVGRQSHRARPPAVCGRTRHRCRWCAAPPCAQSVQQEETMISQPRHGSRRNSEFQFRRYPRRREVLACSFGWSANIDRIGGDSRCYTPFLIIKLRLIQFKW